MIPKDIPLLRYVNWVSRGNLIISKFNECNGLRDIRFVAFMWGLHFFLSFLRGNLILSWQLRLTLILFASPFFKVNESNIIQNFLFYCRHERHWTRTIYNMTFCTLCSSPLTNDPTLLTLATFSSVQFYHIISTSTSTITIIIMYMNNERIKHAGVDGISWKWLGSLQD